MRLVGAGQGQHPFHYHGNNADQIARDGRMLTHPRSRFTTLTVPGQTVDQIFTWTGKGMGWDIYGTGVDYEHDCNGISVNAPSPVDSPGFEEEIQPLIDASCIECHDGDTETALNLEELTTTR